MRLEKISKEYCGYFSHNNLRKEPQSLGFMKGCHIKLRRWWKKVLNGRWKVCALKKPSLLDTTK